MSTNEHVFNKRSKHLMIDHLTSERMTKVKLLIDSLWLDRQGFNEYIKKVNDLEH